MPKYVRLAFVVMAGIFLSAGTASAQNAPVWKKVCADEKKAETCRITQELFVNQKGKDGERQVVGRILGLTVLYATDTKTNKRYPFLSVQLPLGVDLRPGAVLKVDKGEDIPVRYLRCRETGCDVSVQLDSALLKAFQAGNVLHVVFRPWGTAQARGVRASLQGFSKAFKGLR